MSFGGKLWKRGSGKGDNVKKRNEGKKRKWKVKGGNNKCKKSAI
jgi:hypothetical protein